MAIPIHSSTLSPTPAAPRARLRDIAPSLYLGQWPPGPKNGITDVAGVLVHTQSMHSEDGSVNTGVTTIVPRTEWFNKACYAGAFRFNGSGELTGTHWLDETGLLHSPIILTNSFSVGAAITGVYQHSIKHFADKDGSANWFLMPVVGETFDGYLNDLTAMAVKPEDIVRGLCSVSSDPVKEGNTGGGTGMICHGFKAGTGTSSRQVPGVDTNGDETKYTVAALVQANFGRSAHLRIAGVPVGKIFLDEDTKRAKDAGKDAPRNEADMSKEERDGSIITVIATDAPLNPVQLQRLAKRATVGVSRTGGYGYNSSGDIFMAFSTANAIDVQEMSAFSLEPNRFKARPVKVDMIYDQTMDDLIEAAADATEEAIYNSMCMAETMVGRKGHTITAIPLERLKDILNKYSYQSKREGN
ncbi:hypothetical protein NQ176_g1601 [Zarea fungicola]|uniref:Uncharacterized protein n=1 Tax=Zarea fungicola TaxID=93591 RepID=A0ACC1NUG1_9HYPO|nr:hypothetical protein NQ176_g1601 [Lecanicillium fungicola]